jgi:hypothetical protein
MTPTFTPDNISCQGQGGGPTEAVNNFIKRIERIAFGLTVFRHYRILALLNAGRPNCDLLATITPR